MFRLLILLISLAAGGAAAWLALATQAPEAQSTVVFEQAPKRVAEEVLVASADLAQGQALGPETVRWQVWPEDAMNAAFVRRSAKPDAIEAMKNQVVRSHFVAGEPIREQKLASAGSGFLSAILPSGKRAVAVRVSAENTAGGFILPNDRVDVLHTVVQQGQAEGQSGNISRTILTNIRVLAIDQRADETSTEAVALGKTATLELDPTQVESLAAAEASGTLSLALRSTADNDEAPRVTQESTRVVRIIRSGQVETVNIPRDHVSDGVVVQ